jgi:hypothetical protein
MIPYPRHSGSKIFTHRVLYRAFFIIVGIAWTMALLINLAQRLLF